MFVLRTMILSIFALWLLLACSSPEKASEASEVDLLISTFKDAIDMNLKFQKEYPDAETKVQADLEHDFVDFEGNRLLPAFERAVEILTKKDAKTVPLKLLDQMIQLILEYQGGDGGPFRQGLARIYRNIPDTVEKSYRALSFSQKRRLYQILHLGWKEMVKNELLNEWTIELSRRLVNLNPNPSQ